MIFLNEIMITNRDGRLMVSSLQVASDFSKDHRHVTEVIEKLTAENSAVKNFFTESSYINERGRTYKCYEITRDGFSLLVMGFTGKKALEWKLKYIEAFNLMEQKLMNRNTGMNIEEIVVRAVTLAVSETIKALTPLIKAPAPMTDDEPKRIIKKHHNTTPSKISTLAPRT